MMERAALADTTDNAAHIFAVVGPSDKVTAVHNVVENAIKKNYQRILDGKSIQKYTGKLDDTGKAYFKCVQEFFCEQPDHYPKLLFIDCGEFVFSGICCSRLPDDQGDTITDGIASLWLEREEPYLCGKQLILRSFFMRDFVGRKVIACMPQRQTGQWGLIFEGGHQLSFEDGLAYTKETIHPLDLEGFSSSNLQTILMNPIYAYGKWLQPNDLCEEWHKVFIYLCASSDKVWNTENFAATYERFLTFLQDNICKTEEAEPIIPKEMFHRVFLKHIEKFRDFLRGEDEPVISKDLHQALNSRYVYLPYLWHLLPHKKIRPSFSPDALHSMVSNSLRCEDANERGTLWEDTASYMLAAIPEWKITGRRIRAGSQEIDISIANISLDDALWQLGAYILVECKNWRTHVDLHQIRNIAHISSMKCNKTALLFAANGITKDAADEIDRLAAENLSIICITADDLSKIRNLSDCRDLILKKWHTLQDTVNFAHIL